MKSPIYYLWCVKGSNGELDVPPQKYSDARKWLGMKRAYFDPKAKMVRVKIQEVVKR